MSQIIAGSASPVYEQSALFNEITPVSTEDSNS